MPFASFSVSLIGCPAWWLTATAISWLPSSSRLAWMPGAKLWLMLSSPRPAAPRYSTARTARSVRAKVWPRSPAYCVGPSRPNAIEIVEHGLRFLVDVRRGHKTGFYIDQRDNRRLARELAAEFAPGQGPRAARPQLFCYTGGFSIAMLAGGAASVHSVDSSADALALAAEHVRINGLNEGAAVWEQADAFEALRRLNAAGEKFDLIVLDPPKFASSHHHVDRAARAYKDINLQALRLLAPGGTLLSFSCSGAIDSDLFQKIAAGAVFDARVDAWLLARLAAGADHPLMMTVPESEYLKGLRLQRADG